VVPQRARSAAPGGAAFLALHAAIHLRDVATGPEHAYHCWWRPHPLRPSLHLSSKRLSRNAATSASAPGSIPPEGAHRHADKAQGDRGPGPPSRRSGDDGGAEQGDEIASPDREGPQGHSTRKNPLPPRFSSLGGRRLRVAGGAGIASCMSSRAAVPRAVNTSVSKRAMIFASRLVMARTAMMLVGSLRLAPKRARRPCHGPATVHRHDGLRAGFPWRT